MIGPAGTFPKEMTDRTLIWKKPVPPGKSSPVLTATTIFLTSAEGGRLTVLCFDRTTGELLWERSVQEPRKEFQHPLNNAASSTPVTDGQNVYAFFGNFGLISFTADGKERWRVPLGPFSSVWGMAASPVLASGKVIMLLDGFAASSIAAFDQHTGKQLWKSERKPFAMNYSTPVVRRAPDGREEVLAVGPRELVAYDVVSGTVRWSTDIPSGVIVASPAVTADMLYVFTYSLEAVPAFDEELTKTDRNGDGRIGAEEIGTGEHGRVLQTFGTMYGNRDGVIEREEWVSVWSQWIGKPAVSGIPLGRSTAQATSRMRGWRYDRNVPRAPSPLLFKGVLYAFASGGILTALEAKTGTPGRIGRLTGALDNYYSSPVTAGEHIYVVSETGKVVVVAPGLHWTVLAVNDLGEDCFATPAVGEGVIFVRTAGTLWCFGAGK